MYETTIINKPDKIPKIATNVKVLKYFYKTAFQTKIVVRKYLKLN